MIDEEKFKEPKTSCKHYERVENFFDAVLNRVQNLASDNSTLPGCERNE